MRVFLSGLFLLAIASPAPAQVDPAYVPCAACHSLVAGRNGVGPSLNGVVGRRKAAVPNFSYSPAMKAQKGSWTVAELDSFLANPRAKVPGTRMFYPGQPDAAKRKQLIQYLQKQK